MGNPVNDKTITSHHGYMGALERDRLSERIAQGNASIRPPGRLSSHSSLNARLFPLPLPGICQEVDSSSGGVSDQGRGSGCSSSAPARIAPVVRTVCYIAAELVRLVSCVESMKPVLQSLYHRILLYPPPQHRTEAIRIMKEVIPHLSISPLLTKRRNVNIFLSWSDSWQPAAPLRPGWAVCSRT